MNVYLPPRYDLYGNKQVWFIETGRQPLDDVVNGALLAVVTIGPIVAIGGGL